MVLSKKEQQALVREISRWDQLIVKVRLEARLLKQHAIDFSRKAAQAERDGDRELAAFSRGIAEGYHEDFLMVCAELCDYKETVLETERDLRDGKARPR